MSAWTMHNEMEFIDYLGHHSLVQVSRLELLTRYRTALDKRSVPAGLDVGQLMQRCEAKIAFEQNVRK